MKSEGRGGFMAFTAVSETHQSHTTNLILHSPIMRGSSFEMNRI